MKLDFKKMGMGILLILTICLVFMVFIHNPNKEGNVYSVNKVLTQRQKITEDDIELISLDKSSVSESMISDKEELIGKYIKISHTIYPGQVVVEEAIETLEESGDGTTLLLKEAQKLVSIRADLLMTGGNTLGVNQYVDIVYLDKYGEKEAVTLFKNVRIVGVKNRNGEDLEQQGVPYVIMLAVNEDYVNELVTAMENGSISLIGIKNQVDQECIRGDE